MSSSVFERCISLEREEEINVLLHCVSDELEVIQHTISSDLKSWLLVLAGALVFSMQAGFAMLCAGSVRKKNAQNTMLKNLLDACGVALAFFSVGYAFAFGGQNDRTDTTFIGRGNFFNTGNIDLGFWFYEYAVSAATVTIVAGTLAERCKMTAYLFYSVFLSGFVYPVVAHGIWSNNGFLSPFNIDPTFGVGVVDFAGSGVVHLTGGTTALFAAYILGSRRGRFYDLTTGSLLDEPKEIKGHSIFLQCLGTMLLWFGWHGFNPGSALLIPRQEFSGAVGAITAVNTSLSAAGGGVSALFINLYWERRRTGEATYDLPKTLNGCLSGLVAITAGCATTDSWAAIIIGAIAGLLYLWGSKVLIRMRIDDAVDAIPVHMLSGLWGLIAAGLFSTRIRMKMAYGNDQHPGLFYSFFDEFGEAAAPDFSLLGCQLLAVIFIFGWTALLMLPFFLGLNYLGWFRAESVEELIGLDVTYGKTDEEKGDDAADNEFLKAYAHYKSNMRKKRVTKINGKEESSADRDAY